MADTVIIRVEKCTMTINLDPFFADSTLQNIKKLFVLIAKEPWNNEETIGLLLDYLTAMVEKSKQLFDEARATYADGYTDTDFQPELAPHQKRAIERENKRLYNLALKAYREHRRCEKILKYFMGHLYTDYNF